MSLVRTFMTRTGIDFPYGVGFARIANQSTVIQPKRFFEVPYDEQYESRDNESKNWNAKWVHEQYSSLDVRVLDAAKQRNLEEFITKFKSTKIQTDKEISNKSDRQ